MSENKKLPHVLELPEGKKPEDMVSERHDMVLLFEAKKANPNGDPDAENMPRIQPNTLKGLVTDVCQKRKIRNFFSLYKTDGNLIENGSAESGYNIFIRENAILQQLMEAEPIKELAKKIFFEKHETSEKIEKTSLLDNLIKENKKYRYDDSSKNLIITGIMTDDEKKELIDSLKENDANDKEAIEKLFKKSQDSEITEIWKKAKEKKQESYRDALCQTYFDLRAFGGVISTEGPLKGSFYGQVRGPIQFSFAESLDKVLQLDTTITRCCSTSNKEKDQLEKQSDSETGGNRTMGRKYCVDYGLYRTHIYFSPAFAAKTGFTYFDLDNFLFALTHMFTDDTSSSRSGMRVVALVDFQHSTPLGNEHAHKLFEKVKVEMKDKTKEFPDSIEDYWGEAPDGEVADNNKITANKIIWDIPKKEEKKNKDV